MGGDHAPAEIVAGTILANAAGLGYMSLVGDREQIAPLLHGPGSENITIVHAPGVIAMDDAPSVAVRNAAGTSLGVAVELVRDGAADAVVSAGNSGAFLAISLIRLRTIPGIARPAIATVLPTRTGQPCVLLDAGANVDCRPEWLVQFAIMGSAYATAALGIANPRVGLVSNGEERTKGNAQTTETGLLLDVAPVNFIGNVEGRDLFEGNVDVFVTDGFVGNVMLKLAEGAGAFFRDTLRESFENASPIAKLGALLSKPVFAAMRDKINYENYGGAPLLGVRGNCIVAHGRSSGSAIASAIRAAAAEVREDVIGKIARNVAQPVQT
jgi:glycerol-3-phosphate acyltransferase PlsX